MRFAFDRWGLPRRACWVLLLGGLAGMGCTCGAKLVLAPGADASARRDAGEPGTGASLEAGARTDAKVPPTFLADAETRQVDSAPEPTAMDAEAPRTGARMPTDGMASARDATVETELAHAAEQTCDGRMEPECAREDGCVWLGNGCATLCSPPHADECDDAGACDFVEHGMCGIDLLCVPRDELTVRCQAVAPLCGGAEHPLCIEIHRDDCTDCELCDDLPRLFCAFAPDGTMYVLQSNENDVLRVDPGWRRSGSYFGASTLTREQEERCDAVRPLPVPPLPCP